MNITYKNPGYDHSIDSILLFLTGDETPFWSEPIFHFYPQLDKNTLSSCNPAEKHKYLNDVFRGIYENLKEEIESIRTEKQMADAGSGKLREIYAALDSINTEFTEYDDTIVRRLVSKVRIISQNKVIVTLCGSLDIEQRI